MIYFEADLPDKRIIRRQEREAREAAELSMQQENEARLKAEQSLLRSISMLDYRHKQIHSVRII